ncbi:MAG: class I SAM-dependent methyltransferase [Desulfobacterales bacterium]|nr:class I SAM-dependent methyltransferase [Desulfobacterales bacterium]
MRDKVLSWEEAVLWLRGQPEKQELVRACFYDDPPEKSAERFYLSTEWKAVQRLLTSIPCGSVLDIGAGRGISSYAFAQDGWNVTALEPDSSDVVGTGAIRQINRPELNITIEEKRGEQLPFADKTFDLVYGRAVLHHADALPAFCCEAARVLKSGGWFLFTREHVLSNSADLNKFLENHALHHLYQGEYAYKLSEYLQAIHDTGMKCLKVLAPYSSDINLFPSSQQELFGRIKKAKHFPLPNFFIKTVILPKMNKKNNTPGRLYTFFGKKL